MWETIKFIFALLIIFGIPGIFAYFLLFKAHHSNYPVAARGIGIVVLAGILKVAAVVLSDHGLLLAEESYINYGLGALALIGLLMMMAGFGAGPSSPSHMIQPTSRSNRRRRR